MQWFCHQVNPVSLHRMGSPGKQLPWNFQRWVRRTGGRSASRPTFRLRAHAGLFEPSDCSSMVYNPPLRDLACTRATLLPFRRRSPAFWFGSRPGAAGWDAPVYCGGRATPWRGLQATPGTGNVRPARYCRKRRPTELFGTMPFSIRRCPSRWLPVRSHFS